MLRLNISEILRDEGRVTDAVVLALRNRQGESVGTLCQLQGPQRKKKKSAPRPVVPFTFKRRRRARTSNFSTTPSAEIFDLYAAKSMGGGGEE